MYFTPSLSKYHYHFLRTENIFVEELRSQVEYSKGIWDIDDYGWKLEFLSRM